MLCPSGGTDDAIDRYKAGNAALKDDKAEAGKLEALFAAGGACVDAGEYEKAMSLYQDALKEGIKHGQVYNQMGLCQMAEKDYRGALDSFDQGYETFVTGHSLGSGAELYPGLGGPGRGCPGRPRPFKRTGV